MVKGLKYLQIELLVESRMNNDRDNTLMRFFLFW